MHLVIKIQIYGMFDIFMSFEHTLVNLVRNGNETTPSNVLERERERKNHSKNTRMLGRREEAEGIVVKNVFANENSVSSFIFR